MANETHVQFLHSNEMTENNGISAPLLPSSGEVYDGELAVNYGNGLETISFKNSNGEIVTVSSDKENERKYSLWYHGAGGGAVKTAKGNVASGAYSVAEGGPAEFVRIGEYLYTIEYQTEDYARLVLGSGTTAFSAITEAFENTTLLADTIVSGASVSVADADYNNMSMEVIGVFDNGIYVKGNRQDLTSKTSIYIYKFSGAGTTASGPCSHAEGVATLASGEASHTEGYATSATGEYAHAEGMQTLASGIGSHAGGSGSSAVADYSTAIGVGVIANNHGQFSCGKFNTEDDDVLFSIGCGSDENNRADAFSIKVSGRTSSNYTTTVELDGDITMVELPSNSLVLGFIHAIKPGETGKTTFSISEIFDAILTATGNNS